MASSYASIFMNTRTRIDIYYSTYIDEVYLYELMAKTLYMTSIQYINNKPKSSNLTVRHCYLRIRILNVLLRINKNRIITSTFNKSTLGSIINIFRKRN